MIWLMILICAIFLIPGESVSEVDYQASDVEMKDTREVGISADSNSGHTDASSAKGIFGLDPGSKPCAFYLALGERMFRSQELKEARAAFEAVLNLDSQNAQAHYFLGLIEYEEGNVEKAKTRFQIAHDCLALSPSISQGRPDAKQAQVEFPNDYEAKVYYRDGWYIRPKDPRSGDKAVHSLEAGSSYRIELRPKYRESWIRKGAIGFIMMLSFFLAR